MRSVRRSACSCVYRMVVRRKSTSQKEWSNGQVSPLKGAFAGLDGQACCCLRCSECRGMLGVVPRDLDDSGQVFDTALAHELVKSSDGILLEVRCGAVRLK